MRNQKSALLLAAITFSLAAMNCNTGKADYETSFFTLELDPLLRPSRQVERCEHCGGFHTREITSALALLNAQRKRGGVAPLKHAADLEKVARKRLEMMVESGNNGHPPGSFAPGKYEGVGWVTGHTPKKVSACYSMDPNVREAGAVMVHVKHGVKFVVVYR
ncbi:MAG: hypothetical protein ACON5D_10695 [Rubripirellula sp.]